jgi:peptidase M28-like protein/PDZ domain-containing protein
MGRALAPCVALYSAPRHPVGATMPRPRARRGAASLAAAVSLLVSPLAAFPFAAPADGGDATPPARPKPLAKDHPLQKALVTITVDDLKDDEAWLASDDRQGRCAGEASCDEAAEWIADQFEEDGLEPAGDDHTFFQRFEFPVRGAKGRATTRNVVAMLRGSDPALRDEWVLLGGHYDHVGTIKSADAGRIGGAVEGDTIWNGADDNASGTSSVLEIAQALALAGVPTKRSILFLAFSAEEQGLFGSIAWCEHPLVPLEKTAAMVNLDMVGRSTRSGIELGAMGSLQEGLWGRLCDVAWAAAPELDLASHRTIHSDPGSDHQTFLNHSVPALYVFTGYHEDYHRCSDSADKIDYEQMASICRFVTALVVGVADCTEPFRFEMPRNEVKPRKSLGVGVDGALDSARMKELGLASDQGGYEVKSVTAGSAAEKAGLAIGDVILSLNGKPISPDDPLRSLTRLVAAAPSKQDVPLVVLRNGKSVPLTARWE